MFDPAPIKTANDRLKDRFSDVVAYSLMAAVGVHLTVFLMWPEMTATVWADADGDEVQVLRIDDIPMPHEPEPILRPATPRISVDAPPDATIEPIGFDRVAVLPPPPPAPANRIEERAGGFRVFEVPPRLLNPAEFQRALERAYPAGLRDAGIGGTVALQVFIDAEGRALEGKVVTGSGYEALDAAALGLIEVMRFSAALNRDKAVPVWVQLPIEFRVRDDADGRDGPVPAGGPAPA